MYLWYDNYFIYHNIIFQMKPLLTLLVFLIITTISVHAINKYFSNDAIHMKDIKVLTFQKGKFTTGRRSNPIQQLNCIGGTAQSKSYTVENVQCTNSGFNGKTYDWKCESTLDKTLKLGQVVVSCEGYDNSADDYVLVGSCGLEYNLEYTDNYYTQKKHMPNIIKLNTQNDATTDMFFSYVLMVYCVGIVTVITLIACTACCNHKNHTIYHDRPLNRQPVYTPPTPPTVVVDHSSSFAEGFVTGAVLTHRPTAIPPPITVFNPVPTTYASTTSFVSSVQPVTVVNTVQPVTVINPASTPHASGIVQQTPINQDIKETHTSTAYGTTKNR
ncbi:protein of unknown function DUF1183 [Klosneuvirus KNV1]|uniref:Store-operated calcium entry-associated regulatory factor n=1 Tax=Klosneuvirus KNV1 TaxID=1977640 RepID=A0A1V0SKH5_9VIRU|nr:protein of unknown function DUF1183 [Klosneuvirus KNV1]